MKKSIFITFYLLLSCVSYAQEWSITKKESDPMLNTSSYTSYLYHDGKGHSFVFWDNKEDQIRLVTYGRMFDAYDSGMFYGQNVIIGLYDPDGNFIEKFELWMNVDSGYEMLNTPNNGTMSNPVGQKRKVKKIIDHLMNTLGSVRIIARSYGGENIDMDILSIRRIVTNR